MHVHGAPALVDAREPGVVVKDSCSNRRSCTVSLRRDTPARKTSLWTRQDTPQPKQTQGNQRNI